MPKIGLPYQKEVSILAHATKNIALIGYTIGVRGIFYGYPGISRILPLLTKQYPQKLYIFRFVKVLPTYIA